MEMANLHAIPMEVSDPKPVIFQNITSNSGLSNTSNLTVPLGSYNQQQSTKSRGSIQPQLPTSTQSPSLPRAESPAIQETPDPMLVNLAQAFVDLHTLDELESPQIDNGNSSPTISLAQNETESSEANEQQSGPKEAQQEYSDQQMLLLLMRMPAFLAFLRVLVGLLGLLGQTPLPTPSPSMVDGELDETKRLRPGIKAADESEAFTSTRRIFLPGERDDPDCEHGNGDTLLKGLNRQGGQEAVRRT
jgi:hypothetical protein